MTLSLDHIVVAVSNLDQAVQDYRDRDFTVLPGGTHANGATHNALIVFRNRTYIELLARTGAPPEPDILDFSVLLDQGEGFVGYALRSDDLEGDVVRMRGDGIEVGEIMAGERRRGDGELVRWKLALIDDGFAPFLIEDVTPHTLRVSDDPALTTHLNDCGGIHSITIGARDLARTTDRYRHMLGLDPIYSRTDKTNSFKLEVGQITIHQQPQPLTSNTAERLDSVGLIQRAS